MGNAAAMICDVSHCIMSMRDLVKSPVRSMWYMQLRPELLSVSLAESLFNLMLKY